LGGMGRKERGGHFEVRAPQPLLQGKRVEGYISVHPRGFAFVAAEDGGPDVFVPAPHLGAALHGDRVEVIAKPSTRGREGEVVAILGRRPERITGTLRFAGDTPYLEPDDHRLRAPMTIEGDLPEAATEGEAVVATILRFPQSAQDRVGVRVISRLGVQGLT